MTDNQKTIFLRKVLSNDEIMHMKIKYAPLLSSYGSFSGSYTLCCYFNLRGNLNTGLDAVSSPVPVRFHYSTMF